MDLPRTGRRRRRITMMGTKIRSFEPLPRDVSLQELVPKDNFYRRLGRQVLRHFDEEYVDRVKAYRGTFPYEKALRKRRVWVEPLFAEAKDWHGMRRFRLRRLEKVNAEVLMIASGQNVKRLIAFGDRSPRKLAQAGALRPPERFPGTEHRGARRHRRPCVLTLKRFSTG
jgi:hypothetical protein